MALTGTKWVVERYGGTGGLKTVDFVVDFELGAEDVLLKVLATDSTYTDLLVLQGNYLPKAPLPVTPGYCGVGEVLAMGAACKRIAIGQRVAFMPKDGCAATHRTLAEGLCVPVRTDVSPVDVVPFILTGVTAHQMLHRVAGKRIGPTAAILVHGCVGGTGAMLVELAKLAGVRSIYGTCSARNIAAATAQGVQAFDYRTDWAKAVREACPGGLDVVYDPVLLGGYRSAGMRLLKRGGKLVAYGATNTAAPGTFSSFAGLVLSILTMSMQQNLIYWFDGREAEFYNVSDRRDVLPAEFAADLVALVDRVAYGSLKPASVTVWSFADVKTALASIEAGTSVGKQVIRVQA
jgi:NADPH:quinone reductase-like Zn-dependent oxidoreductase